MNKYIIITSIFEPTAPVKEFAKVEGFKVIVVGDKKSPDNYEVDNVEFISVKKELGFKIEAKLPFNHYCRKMLGYLSAIKNGADVIVDTDDDNSPKSNWEFPSFTGHYNFIDKNNGFINIYNLYTEQKIWPRGFPLNLISDKKDITINNTQSENLKIGIWQGLADNDPDVDAIYRLTDNTPCFFDETKEPIVLEKGTLCPFNSQNTAFIKELFPLLYLPATVTFRFTDILRGLVAQPLMWNYGYNLGFTTATVTQDRNIHNYMKDFESEIPCFLLPEKIINITKGSIKKDAKLTDNLFNVYKALFENKIVEEKELEILSSWIEDINRLTNT